MEKKEPKPIEGIPIVVEQIAMPKGAVLCPRLSQLMLRTGGFGKSEMTMFALECVGVQCGMYNACKNIQGNVQGKE